MYSRSREKEQNGKSVRVCLSVSLGVFECIRAREEELGTVGKPRPIGHVYFGVYFRCRDGGIGNRTA